MSSSQFKQPWTYICIRVLTLDLVYCDKSILLRYIFTNTVCCKILSLFPLFLCLPVLPVSTSSPPLSLSQGQLTNTGKHMYCELLQGLAAPPSMLAIPRWHTLEIYRETGYTPKLFTLFFHFVQGESMRGEKLNSD